MFIIDEGGQEPELVSIDISSSEKYTLLQELINNCSYSRDLVYVLTPEGDVESLSVGSTPIDFAYKIHTDIGNHCSEAKVNGKKVPLNTPLKNGDTIEIITRKNSHPKAEWLRIPENPEIEHPFIKSSKTRSKIKQWFRKRSYDESISRGQELLEQEIGKTNIEILQKSDIVLALAQDFNYPKVDGLLAALGYGVISLQKVINGLNNVKYYKGRDLLIKELGNPYVEILEKSIFYLEISNRVIFDDFREFLIALGSHDISLDLQILKKLKDRIRQLEIENENKQKSVLEKPLIDEKYIRLIVGGEESIPYRFAPCCQVCLYGNNVGVVKRGGMGIVVHSKNCRNLKTVKEGRLVSVTNAVNLEIRSADRVGMEIAINNCFAKEDLNIREGSVKTPNGEAIFLKSITILNLDQIKKLLNALREIQEMEDVYKASFIEKKVISTNEGKVIYFEEK